MHGVSIIVSTIKELNVVTRTGRTSIDTIRRLDSVLNPCIAIGYFNGPFTLEVLLWVTLRPSWCLETATCCSQSASTHTRSSISCQTVAFITDTSEGTICVFTAMFTVVCPQSTFICNTRIPCVLICTGNHYYQNNRVLNECAHT